MTTLDLSRTTTGDRSADGLKTDILTQRAWSVTLEQIAYALIVIAAIVTRFYALGDRALHHDETLHATYAWNLFTGKGYMHDPLLHGPFLYHFGALVFFLFGDNDFTARAGAAFFSVVLTMLPLLLRRELGRPVALLASFYLLLSPVFLYIGRFIRHDIYSVTFELLVVIGIVRYATSRRPAWLYLVAAAFGLMIVNQETSYLFLLISATPLVLFFFWRVFRPGILLMAGLGIVLALLVFVLPGTAQVDGSHNAQRDAQGRMLFTPGPLLGWYPLETQDNSYALRIRNRSDNDGGRSLMANVGVYFTDLGKFFGHPALLISLALSVVAIAVLIYLIWFDRRRGTSVWQRAIEQGDGGMLGFASLGADRRLLVALGVFLGIYALFFTAFFTNMLGLITGTTGSVLYWLAQHNVQRGDQPRFYYFIQLIIYEPLLLLWSLVGTIVLARLLWVRWRQSDESPAADTAPAPRPALLLPLFFLWWAVSAFAIYSWAGEKMPWLTVHVALPLVFLAAWSCVHVLDLRHWLPLETELEFRDVLLPIGIMGAIFIAILGLGFVLMTAAVGVDKRPVPLWVIPLFVVIMSILLAMGAGFRWGWRWSLSLLAVGFSLLLVLTTVRSSYRLSYLTGDTPREMMIFVQTSPDVMQVVRRLEEAARRRGSTLDMPVLYDNETVWSWYMRNFSHAIETGPQLVAPPTADVQAVLMLQENLDAGPNRDYLREFRIQRLPLRWWISEDALYRLSGEWRTQPIDQVSLVGRTLREPFADTTLVRLWDFLLFRDLKSPLGSTDFVIAVRPELADQLGIGIGGTVQGNK